MASLIDSEAQLTQRLADLHASDNLKRAFQRGGLTSYGVLAYAHGQLGQPLVDDAFDTWLAQVVPGASIADTSMAKRLLFEAQTLVLASLKEQITNQHHDPTITPKKVPPAEREAKMQALRQNLNGVLIEGPLEPAHVLLNHCAAMAQANECRYLAPEQCVSRTHEVLHHRSPSKQLDISAASLIVKETKEVPDMAATSALQVQEALTRRGLGLTFADLVSYNAYTRYLTSLSLICTESRRPVTVDAQ